ncbi:hypothetical protein DSO57_1019551 [Entomophthora muscae]|uniref:Uncharacterized protein n=1 Tax=Entomophthora muscae TaxID=34485 RepID=A0ACC2S6C9_9FUNG|nr:hypothetical protein DSO57_1019551 [Entomophthora muscae]
MELDMTLSKNISVHLLPCKIEATKDARVEDYFVTQPYVASVDNLPSYMKQDSDVKLKEAYFRGRRLIGRPVLLSQDYEGALLVKEEGSLTKEATFDSFTVFEHDYPPNPKENPFLLAQDWLAISNVLHAHTPIDE